MLFQGIGTDTELFADLCFGDAVQKEIDDFQLTGCKVVGFHQIFFAGICFFTEGIIFHNLI